MAECLVPEGVNPDYINEIVGVTPGNITFIWHNIFYNQKSK